MEPRNVTNLPFGWRCSLLHALKSEHEGCFVDVCMLRPFDQIRENLEERNVQCPFEMRPFSDDFCFLPLYEYPWGHQAAHRGKTGLAGSDTTEVRRP